MPSGKYWTKKQERILLQGVGIYGITWFCSKTGVDTGRSYWAVHSKARRLFGAGGLSRGSYTLREACLLTGYSRSQIKRAMSALAQKWKRTSRHGSYLIYEEQFDDIVQWLKTDYWSKKHRLYNCLWCGTEKNAHRAQGLCTFCLDKYVKRLKRLGLPCASKKLLVQLQTNYTLDDKLMFNMIKSLKINRALPYAQLMQLEGYIFGY